MNKLLTALGICLVPLTVGCGPDDGGGGPSPTLWYADIDKDGQGDPSTEISSIGSPGIEYVGNGTDCNDDDSTTYLGATELCDGKDNSCDGSPGVDEVNADGDLFMVCENDCNDAVDTIYPGAIEATNLVDDNCDGTVDEHIRYVFITELTHGGGDFGGLSGADAICASEATTAGLPGTYKAWMSDSVDSAASRLTHSVVPYVRTDGEIVANSWADLIDSGISVDITLYADNTRDVILPITDPPLELYGVLTGTNNTGTLTGNNCLDWTDSSGGEGAPVVTWGFAGFGDAAGAHLAKWTIAGTWAMCEHFDAVTESENASWHHYCFQQEEGVEPTPLPDVVFDLSGTGLLDVPSILGNGTVSITGTATLNQITGVLTLDQTASMVIYEATGALDDPPGSDDDLVLTALDTEDTAIVSGDYAAALLENPLSSSTIDLCTDVPGAGGSIAACTFVIPPVAIADLGIASDIDFDLTPGEDTVFSASYSMIIVVPANVDVTYTLTAQ